ncbi:hypothetical protein [Streptomyces sp. NPDC006997]|uniref:hypothetical protein n=1 Tax=Streptomyces sp. NPDC006997 TaxID=3155356 RepID=UPI0033CCC238
MAQASWPSPGHNTRNVTDAEYEELAARFSDDGVYGTPADTAVVTPGVGLSVNIRADVFASVRGHAWMCDSTGDTLPISANASGSTRVDLVVLRLDRSDWTVRAVVREGTPGSGAPTLVQDEGDTGLYEIPLARVTLLTGASSVTVARTEQYVGSRCRPCTSTTRNPNPVIGEHCYETDTDRVRVWTGSAWKIVYSHSGLVDIDSPVSVWSVQVGSVLEEKNGNVHLRLGTFQRTGGTLENTTPSRLPVLIPAEYRHPTRDQFGLVYITGLDIGRITIYAGNNSDTPGQVWLTNKPSIATGTVVAPASGLSWVVN